MPPARSAARFCGKASGRKSASRTATLPVSPSIPANFLTTGDGGMLTTADAAIDRKFRLWRQHGMSVPDTVRHSSQEVVFESYPELGFNYRLTDIQAAIGREQLKRLPDSDLAAAARWPRRYRQLLADIPGLDPAREPEWARTNWQSYCVRLPENTDQRAGHAARCSTRASPRAEASCARTLSLLIMTRRRWRCAQTGMQTRRKLSQPGRK